MLIYDKWDWSTKYTVIKISFASGDYETPEMLKEEILNNLEDVCEDLDIQFNSRLTLKKLIRIVY